MKQYDITNRTNRAISIQGRKTPLKAGETIAGVYMPDDAAERYRATPTHFKIKDHEPELPAVTVTVAGEEIPGTVEEGETPGPGERITPEPEDVAETAGGAPKTNPKTRKGGK